ncbi:MAG: DJ-1/PfpI family protein [Bacteroidota bacterium]
MKRIIILIAIILFANISYGQKNTVLIIMSSADTLKLNNGEKLRQTGVFLNEFYLPYKMLSDNGYQIQFATPNGIVATIDNESTKDNYWKDDLKKKEEAVNFVENDSLFNNPITLEEAIENRNDYIGLVIPGGQGLMIDLSKDKNIPILLKHFAKEKKPTGLICHAPSLILTIPKEENPYIGFKVNSVSPFEEFVIERFIMKGKPKNRKIAKQLKKMGLNYKQKLPKSNFAVKDRNLVTSQNPYSSSSFNILFLKALTKYFEVEK